MRVKIKTVVVLLCHATYARGIPVVVQGAVVPEPAAREEMLFVMGEMAVGSMAPSIPWERYDHVCSTGEEGVGIPGLYVATAAGFPTACS